MSLVPYLPGTARLGAPCVPANAGAHEREHRERGIRYGRAMRKPVLTVLLLAALALGGCTAAPAAQETDAGPTVSSETPSTTPAGAATLAEAAENVGCDLGPTAQVTPPASDAGTCDMGGDSELAFVWEFESPTAARGWLESGALEIGATDAVFIDGSVVLLARDAATAQTFAASAEPYQP